MNRNKTSPVSFNFYTAATDYIFLLEKEYPVKSIVKLVGDKYKLSAAERVLLYRGIVKKEKLQKRKNIKCSEIPENSLLFLDGFNILRTVGSYLNGNFVFKGMDNFVRDVSELHRKALKSDILERSLLLIFDFISTVNPVETTMFFDKPISHSGKMAELANTEFKKRKLNGKAVTVFSPDHELKNITKGIICTADSAIIDSAQVPVFDLPAALLTQRFSSNIFSLSEIKQH